MGLKQDIMKAANETELALLHTKGLSFDDATPKTRRQWQQKANARHEDFALLAFAAEQKVKAAKASKLRK